MAIHPAQLASINEVFSTSPEKRQWAEGVIAAFAANPNSGTLALDGKMIDVPVVERARLLLERRTPSICAFREVMEAGALMSYGVNTSDSLRRAAFYIDKILKGANPGDLPVEQPSKIELIINLTTAKALGLDVPLHWQQLADEVIE